MPSLTLLLPGLLALAHTPPTRTPIVSAAPGTFAIVGARLEIGDGTVIENGTVVIRDGRIAAIGSGIAVPGGARTVDGKGLVVFPGFVDAYSTFGLTLPAPTANVGSAPDTVSTAPATMWAGNRKGLRADVRAATILDAKADWTARAAQGVTTMLLSGGNGSIAGTAALVSLASAATPTVLVGDAGEEFVLRGSGRGFGAEEGLAVRTQGQTGSPPNTTPPGGPPTTTQNPTPATPPPATPGQGQGPRGGAPAATAGYNYPGTLFGIVALVRQTLYDARDYATQTDPKPAVDPTYEALRPLMGGRMPGIFTLSASRDIARAARISDEFGFRFIVNGVPDAYRMVDLLKARAVPVIVSLDVPDAPSRQIGTSADALPARVIEDRYAQYQERIANARVLDAAGVPLAFRRGDDDFLVGVRKLVKASGLPRAAALRALALNPARMYGADGQIGTLAVGKRADLVILTGDFLDDGATVRATYVGGDEIVPKKADAPKADPPKADPPKPDPTGTTPPPTTTPTHVAGIK